MERLEVNEVGKMYTVGVFQSHTMAVIFISLIMCKRGLFIGIYRLASLWLMSLSLQSIWVQLEKSPQFNFLKESNLIWIQFKKMIQSRDLTELLLNLWKFANPACLIVKKEPPLISFQISSIMFADLGLEEKWGTLGWEKYTDELILIQLGSQFRNLGAFGCF